MIHFWKAIKLSLRYKWSIAGAVFCSMMIGLLWGATISTVFPFVEIVFKGETIESWVAREIDEADDKVAKLDLEIASIRGEIADDPQNADALKSRLRLENSARDREQQALEWYIKVQPLVIKHSPKTPFGTLLMAMVWLVSMSALKGVFLVLSVILVSRVANRTVMDLRRIYYHRALGMAQSKVDKIGTNTLMTLLSHNMVLVSAGLSVFYGKMLREPLKMLTCLVLAAMISWQLLLISLFVVPFGAFIINYLARRMKNAVQREIGGMAGIFQTLSETLSALKTVRIFNRERSERKRFKENAGIVYRMNLRITLYDSLLRPISEMLGIISIAMAILVGGYLVLNNETTIFGIPLARRALDASVLMMFYGMLAGASDPARKMSEIVNVLVRGATACENMSQTFDGEDATKTVKYSTVAPLHSQSIQFQNLNFGYYQKHEAIKNLDLHIPQGQTLAIVGANGCGKSTLVGLLARFYEPRSGKICVDGVDIAQVNPRKWRQQLAWVTQDSQLFDATLWENIAYGKFGATDEEVHQAAELARVEKFIPNLKNGYQTEIGEQGRLLSAGQRQRVALARAILANPAILILDEATSQMDGHAEKMIHKTLQPFLAGRTTILITHRQSSLVLADRIVVMDAGQIVSDSSNEGFDDSQHFHRLFSKSA